MSRGAIHDRLIAMGSLESSEADGMIIGLGDQVVPQLLDLVDAKLFDERLPGRGFVPIHAMRILGRMRARESIPKLMEMVRTRDDAEIALDVAIGALVGFGSVAVEPVLEALDAERSEAVRGRLEGILASFGLKDERIFNRLVAAFRDGRDGGAARLAQYGDARAIDVLIAGFERPARATESPFLAGHHEVEIVGAVRKLGGELPGDLQTKLGLVLEEREKVDRFVIQETKAELTKKLGRNDPCWCGSGKKLKKCHGKPV